MRENFFINNIESLSQSSHNSIALPESFDLRTLQAISYFISKATIDNIVCFGQRDQISNSLKASGISQNLIDKHCTIYTPHELQEQTFKHLQEMAIKRNKNLDEQQLQNNALHPLYQAGFLLAKNKVQCVVAGATHPTAEVIRAGLASVGLMPGLKTLSGSFAMIKDRFGFIFADCAVIIDPSSEQLVEIAYASYETFRTLFASTAAQVAFLSFSTKGSASHAQVEKIATAAALFRSKYPHIPSDGEIQFDAAFLPEVRLRKAPESSLTDCANIYIFPDLNSGNIAYKIAQRLGGFCAYGPILQGLARAYSDLSRGASPEDIIASVYINLLRNQTLTSIFP